MLVIVKNSLKHLAVIRSFVPGKGADGLSVGLGTDGTTPEFSEKLVILGVVDGIHLSVLVVFELRMVVHLLRNFGTSEEPDTHDVVVTFNTDNSVSSESVLLEVVDSLHETIEEVVSLEKNLLEYKFNNTQQMISELHKVMHAFNKAAGADFDSRQLVLSL